MLNQFNSKLARFKIFRRQNAMNFRLITIFALIFLSQNLQASCLLPPSYSKKFEILACEEVNLNALHPPVNWQGLLSYQGVILQIKILSTIPIHNNHALVAEHLPNNAQVFYQTTAKEPCTLLKPGTQKKAISTAACCDGDPNAPCLLGFSEYIYDLKPVKY